MVSRTAGRRAPARAGFTLIELLVGLALVVLVTAVVSAGFAASAAAFRELKATGDLNERLRDASADLRRDNLAAGAFVAEALATGSADPREAAALRRRYEATAATAEDLDVRLAAQERGRPPDEVRVVRRTREALARVRAVAVAAALVLREIEED